MVTGFNILVSLLGPNDTVAARVTADDDVAPQRVEWSIREDVS